MRIAEISVEKRSPFNRASLFYIIRALENLVALFQIFIIILWGIETKKSHVNAFATKFKFEVPQLKV